jgi:hypothetical protein
LFVDRDGGGFEIVLPRGESYSDSAEIRDRMLFNVKSLEVLSAFLYVVADAFESPGEWAKVRGLGGRASYLEPIDPLYNPMIASVNPLSLDSW